MMPSDPSWSLTFVEPDIAVLSINTSGRSVNLLSHAVLDELAALLDQLAVRRDLAGLIVCSAKPGTFIAGVDLVPIAAALKLPREEVVRRSRHGQTVLARLAELPLVTVAAIDGVCLGAGAELACWCDRRVLSTGPRTEFGFPEVKLGLIPGWGGTARFPRIVGLGNAAELIATGEAIDAAHAAAMGLADDSVRAEGLMAAAVALVREARDGDRYLDDRRQRSSPLEISRDELHLAQDAVREEVHRRTFLHHAAPSVALEVLAEAAGCDLAEACRIESEAVARLYGSPENVGLLNVFFLADRNRKHAGAPADSVPRPVHSVGVIGAGTMGTGIAAAAVKRELRVLITDASSDALRQGVRAIGEEVAYNKRLRGPDPAQALRLAPYLGQTAGVDELAAADFIVETVVENADVKRRIFQRLEPKLAPRAVIASNTSTIPITQLAAALQRPERCCGLHFFNPVRHMKLVEVVRGARTDDETVATAVAFVRRIGKLPIVVQDGPGFLVNRLLSSYLNESMQLICEGVTFEELDQAAVAFGMPLGPMALCDLIGLDTVFYAGLSMWEAYPDQFAVTPVLPALCRRGRLGRKTGSGFFSYRTPSGPPEPDPEVSRLLEPYVRRQRAYSREEITQRLFLPVLVEATRILQSRIVPDPRDVDLGIVFGLGFPRFRGGLLFWADTLGAATIVEQLQPWQALGVRYRPTDMLLAMARENRKFYDGLAT